jgi:hypothetical protein
VAKAVVNIVGMLQDMMDRASGVSTLLDVDTTAGILNLSPSMVRVLCAKGTSKGGLDAQKLGGEWRINRASVEARLGRER